MFKKILSLLIVFFIVSSLAATVYADQPVFGPKDLKIKRWYFHFSSHRFKVDDPAEGVLTIIKNTPGKKIRGGFCFVNGKYIRLRNFLKGKSNIFEKEVKLRSRNRVFIFFRGSRRASIRVDIRKKGTYPPPEVSLTANPTTADPTRSSGDQSWTLSWNSNFADTCSIEPGIGKVDLEGSRTVSPTETTTYTITATGSGGTATAKATVTLANSAPVANNQNITLNEDQATSIVLTASDANGDALAYQVVTGPSHGTLTGQAPNLTYTPSPNYNGNDSFTFTANDGSLDSNMATVTLAIQPVNDSPTAVDDTVTTDEDTPIGVIRVLANDTDPENDTLSVDFGLASNGIANTNLDGTLNYKPDSDHSGTDSFTYTISDGNGGTASATVRITINPVNDAPTANSQAVTLNEDDTASITLTAIDVDGDSLTYQIVSNPSHGTLTGYVPNITYTPAENYSGDDTFTFRVNDGTVDSGVATVAITVNPVNDPPVANAGDDQNGLPGDVILDGSGSNDIDGNNLTYSWTFISFPGASVPTLTDSSTMNPNFTADLIGTYEIQLIVNDGTVSSAADTVTVNIVASPTAEISAFPVIILSGESSELTWTCTNADTCVIDPDVSSATTLHGTTIVYPSETTIYRITAANAGGTATDSVTVTVNVPPTVNFDVPSATIAQGEPYDLTWTSENADSGHIDSGIGTVSVNGSETVNPLHTTTYTISVTNDYGNASAKATIKVAGSPMPQPDGSFGQQYEDLVPPDSTVDQYDPWRFSLVTGMVQTLDGSPMPDVSITIHSHPEYGTVYTDETGRFSMPVEGGGAMTVIYQKDGFLPVHRKVSVSWNDIAIADTLRMIEQDTESTTIAFDGTVTHQSTLVTDEFGSRSLSMVFSGDSRAWPVDENGNIVRDENDINVLPLKTINVRAREFTTLNSMPAALPANSAYTYSAELVVDGVPRVRFDQPVITWVDNFLGFDVGEIVPAGYYDRDQGVWVPFDNGVVVRLLDTDSDGIVDALDDDDDGIADDLDNDGVVDEVIGLGNSLRYAPGATFLRVALNHFAPWGFNWPFVPPVDATASQAEGKATVDQQALNEDIPIPGTDITLHYASNRVQGYQTLIDVPVSGGDTLPASLKRIEVRVEVAGQTIEQQVLNPLPDQVARVVWDGLDYLGRQAQGPIFARVNIGFVYDAVYLGAESDFPRSFAQTGNEMPTGILTRQEVIYWKNDKIQVLSAKGINTVADGWTLSAHHKLHPVDPTALYKGDGTTIRNNMRIIDTVEASLASPQTVAVDKQGNFYIADYTNHIVRKVDTSGILTTVAGGGNSTDDGVWATDAQLNYPYGVAVDYKGNLFISDRNNFRIRKVDTSGIITTVAGNGNRGYSGDNGPAIEAELHDLPASSGNITIDNEGNLYIVDSYRIRMVDPGGIITTVVGNGSSRHFGDGGPAIDAQLRDPFDVAADNLGNLYITEDSSNRIRKINTSGIITTIAGDGSYSSTGDGGPAKDATVYFPSGIATDSTGNLYFGESWGYRVRKIDTHGMITTVAGNGSYGSSGDGGPATEASLMSVWGLAVDSRDNIYIPNGETIRKVAPQFFIDRYYADGRNIPFAEENNLSHIMSSSGQHIQTVDTGATLHAFEYDADNQLINITDDQFGNISINRDAAGVPISVDSPGGATTLIIDGSNHLVEMVYPDDSFYSFEYDPDGLMTLKIDPDGNRFEY